MRELSDIEARIDALRTRVFSAGDGVVPREMTALEQEWLAASRARSTGGELDRLFDAIAPERWRDEPRRRAISAEAIVTLASDPDGIEEAERAVGRLRDALAPWGVELGPSIEWIVSREITFTTRSEDLLGSPLAALRDAASEEDVRRALRRSHHVGERAGTIVVPTRNGSIARELALLALAETLWDARPPADRPSPIAPLLTVWRLGYALSTADASGFVLTALPATP